MCASFAKIEIRLGINTKVRFCTINFVEREILEFSNGRLVNLI